MPQKTTAKMREKYSSTDSSATKAISYQVINPDRGGYFRTVKSNYYKQSALNILERQRKNYIATGILIEYTTNTPRQSLLRAKMQPDGSIRVFHGRDKSGCSELHNFHMNGTAHTITVGNTPKVVIDYDPNTTIHQR